MAQYRLERLAPVASDLEQLGTKEKFWFSMDTEPKLWLFKFSRAGTGEHWSEKCAAELCHWICPYISRHLLSLNPLQARCRRYSRGER